MDGGIFLLEDGELTRITEERYDSESLLQRFLADHPDLLAGELIDETEPRRWLLLSKEAGVPDEEEGSGRWAVDHLFVDQDAVPTIVEVKRSEDTRIRRAVVGQMLEYAANASTYWEIEELRARFEERARAAGREPEHQLAKLLGDEADQEAFWSDVETHLDAGKVRMLFVADEIPAELKRIVEFLNEHMERPEVLAIELKQYTGENQRALVPRVYGKTARSEKQRSTSARGRWDEDRFLRVARDNLDGETFEAVSELYQLSIQLIDQHGGRVKWGTGAKTGSFNPIIEPLTPETLEESSMESSLYTITTDGGFRCKFWFDEQTPAGELAEQFKRRLFKIEGMEQAHEEHCGGTAGIPPETWVPRKDEITEAIEGFYRRANG